MHIILIKLHILAKEEEAKEGKASSKGRIAPKENLKRGKGSKWRSYVSGII